MKTTQTAAVRLRPSNGSHTAESGGHQGAIQGAGGWFIIFNIGRTFYVPVAGDANAFSLAAAVMIKR